MAAYEILRLLRSHCLITDEMRCTLPKDPSPLWVVKIALPGSQLRALSKLLSSSRYPLIDLDMVRALTGRDE